MDACTRMHTHTHTRTHAWTHHTPQLPVWWFQECMQSEITQYFSGKSCETTIIQGKNDWALAEHTLRHFTTLVLIHVKILHSTGIGYRSPLQTFLSWLSLPATGTGNWNTYNRVYFDDVILAGVWRFSQWCTLMHRVLRTSSSLWWSLVWTTNSKSSLKKVFVAEVQ